MESTTRKSNKIREVVRLQQILKKWKKIANVSTNSCSAATSSSEAGSGSRSMKFLKRTLSLTDVRSATPKGFVAVSVGEERKRFVIPTEYLGHEAFRVLLRKAEEEFGFQQEGVLRIPCGVSAFEKILKMVEIKKDAVFLHDFGFSVDGDNIGIASSSSSCSPDADLPPSHHPQMCR